MTSLPVIDISAYMSDSSPISRKNTATQLNRACAEHGFFYLKGHGIPSAATDRVLDLARRFFLESSEDDKRRIQRQDAGVGDGDGARGYQNIGENVTSGKRDWHEAVDLYAELDGELCAESPPYQVLKGRNLWPSKPQELRRTYEEYIEQVKLVGSSVVRAMGDALDLTDVSSDEGPDVFAKATHKSFWVMRMIGYPRLPSSDLTGNRTEDMEHFSCGAHTDYGCVTLLLADSTPNALQLQTKSGEWITANLIPGAFVVNIGDMMERWMNGLWKSTNHRVLHRGENFRVSVPFFFEPNYDAVIKPLAKCVQQTGSDVRYDSVVYGPYLEGKVKGNFY